MASLRKKSMRAGSRVALAGFSMIPIALLSLLSVAAGGTTPAADTLRGSQADTVTYISPVEVLISAQRITIPLKEVPAATTVVGNEILRGMPKTIAPDEALRLVPGVKVDNQADGERVHMSIRGQGILSEHGLRGIRAMLDGIPLSDPTGFTPDLYDVDWETLERCEVLRGPAASLYGGSASGGVLNLVTPDANRSPLWGGVSSVYGTYDFWKLLGQFGAASGDVAYRGAISRTMSDGYRDHTKYWGNNMYGKASWRPSSDIEISPVIGWTDFFNENAEGLNLEQVAENPRQANPDAAPKNEYIRTSRFLTGTTLRYTVEDVHELVATAFIRRTVYGESVPVSVLHRTMTAPGGSLQYNLHTRGAGFSNVVGAGADVQWQTIDEYKKPNLGDAMEGFGRLSDETIDQRGIGLFLLDRLDLGSEVSISGNVRGDWIHNALADHLLAGGIDLSGDADFDRVTGRVGITYMPVSSLNLYANWGSGFLPPATEELANNPDAQGGFNKNLAPATSQSVELGLRGLYGKEWYADLALFWLTTDNDFDRYRVPSRPLETFYRNSGSTRRLGAELYARWMPEIPVTAQIAFTYSNFVYTMTTRPRVLMDDTSIVKFIEDGNWLPNSPMHQLAVDVRYAVMPALSVGMDVQVFSRSFIDGANVWAESVPGFALFDAQASYRLPLASVPGTFLLTVRNVFDRTYIAFTEPDPGGNSYQPGPRREIFAGLKIDLGSQ